MAKEISPREAERRRQAALKAQDEKAKPHDGAGHHPDPHMGKAQKSAKQRIQRHQGR
jgi:hypothetical protein